MSRPSERLADELRPVSIERHYTKHAEGSVLISIGDTKVLCNASVEERVPRFLHKTGKGWVTSEYSLLPRSTHTRISREAVSGRQQGRTQEIQRLIGRSLRAAVNFSVLGERTITIDCDVIQADGGTRTAAITGGYVALCDAINWLLYHEIIEHNPIEHAIASISVGIYEGEAVLDLDYAEDCQADTDMNLVMSSQGGIIEIQGTAENKPFERDQLITMLDYAEKGTRQLLKIQQDALAS